MHILGSEPNFVPDFKVWDLTKAISGGTRMNYYWLVLTLSLIQTTFVFNIDLTESTELTTNPEEDGRNLTSGFSSGAEKKEAN